MTNKWWVLFVGFGVKNFSTILLTLKIIVLKSVKSRLGFHFSVYQVLVFLFSAYIWTFHIERRKLKSLEIVKECNFKTVRTDRCLRSVEVSERKSQFQGVCILKVSVKL